MSTLAATLAPGDMIGSYRIVKEIGRGGMGTVYEALHEVMPRRAAIKVMHGALCKHPGMATRLVQEAGILEATRHPGIVRVYECNVLPDRRPWIAMELVEGVALAERLLEDMTLGAAEVCKLIADVADVLVAVHARGVVHRDLKPDNLLLTPKDGRYGLRVIDWGIARLGTVGRLTIDGVTAGTPIYMSPEQACGRDIAGPCDVYSLGVIAYEALTGRPPFDGGSLAEILTLQLQAIAAPLGAQCPDAPATLCALVHATLAKQPEQRPTALELRDAARAILAELEAGPPPYEAYDLTGVQDRAVFEPSDDTVVIDPDYFDLGETQPIAAPSRARSSRWTPEIRPLPIAMIDRPREERSAAPTIHGVKHPPRS